MKCAKNGIDRFDLSHMHRGKCPLTHQEATCKVDEGDRGNAKMIDVNLLLLDPPFDPGHRGLRRSPHGRKDRVYSPQQQFAVPVNHPAEKLRLRPEWRLHLRSSEK